MYSLPSHARTLTVPTTAGRLSAVRATPDGGAANGVAVLVPGFTGSKEDFVPMLRGLTDSGYDVLTYSQQGQWLSEGPDDADDYTVEAFATGLLEVLDTAVPDERVHLAGHSFGGLVTRAAVIREPDRFRSYTILCSGPGGSTVTGPAGPTLQDAIAAEGSAGAWRFLEPFFAAGAPEPVVTYLRTRIHETNPANLLGIARAIAGEPDRVAELRATGVPIMVAHGENDAAWPPEAQREMAARLGARYEVIAGTGHTPNEEKPDVTARLFAEFWAQAG
ncbi:alpha/beta hydrolase [Amycolatopsis roodepoortensis]|uniref:alpha/beta fold hydrolase n=1 Tax=Amycolatopsis roodepoortensis TaxID=700274 RepID=UPI00214B36BC|nr:alpha/beta hydrolase [Amycolatopsis roodepoortensis]UUV31502.1 alpha/beta hydrolase [Amycolatopsis roodepoortensis]